MPHTTIYQTDPQISVLDEPELVDSVKEQPQADRAIATDAYLPAFDLEVEADHLGEETLMYKEILVFLTLILFVLLRSLLV